LEGWRGEKEEDREEEGEMVEDEALDEPDPA
jgi:hypothetical protein